MAALQSAQVKDLKETFRVFSKLSETLEHSYLHLEDRISELRDQLADEKELKRKASNETNRVAGRLNTILDALPAGVVVLGPDGIIQDCNPAAVDLLQSSLIDENWLEVVERVFDLKVAGNDEIWLNDGRCVTLATCPLGHEPGQVILINDVTETRKLQNKLNQHQRLTAIGEMAAGMAHQLRTPLSSSVLCCSQLKNANLDEAKRTGLVEKVLSYMGELEKVINNTLVFSRSGFEGQEQFTLSGLVDEVVNSLQPITHQTRTIVSIQNNTSIDNVVGNRVMLNSAIQNILTNAIQSMDSEGRLDLVVQNNQGATVELVIRDTGKGIPLDIQGEIFKPFFTTRSKGTGLGLSVVQAIVRAHQGEIWLQASSPAEGSTFILRLPTVESTND